MSANIYLMLMFRTLQGPLGTFTVSIDPKGVSIDPEGVHRGTVVECTEDWSKIDWSQIPDGFFKLNWGILAPGDRVELATPFKRKDKRLVVSPPDATFEDSKALRMHLTLVE